MKKHFIHIFALLLALFSCKTITTPVEDVSKEKSDLEKIAEIYKGYDCFSARLKIEAQSSKGNITNAAASLRADNKNKRMHLILRDPIFSLPISRITIQDGTVYSDDIRNGRKKTRLDDFYVQGMGENSIMLPFSFFQEILYGKLPDEVFAKSNEVFRDQDRLIVRLKSKQSRSQYEFENNRLLVFQYGDAYQAVKTELSGQVDEDASFPRSINIVATPPNRASEKLNVEFVSVNIKDSCGNQHFPVF